MRRTNCQILLPPLLGINQELPLALRLPIVFQLELRRQNLRHQRLFGPWSQFQCELQQEPSSAIAPAYHQEAKLSFFNVMWKKNRCPCTSLCGWDCIKQRAKACSPSPYSFRVTVHLVCLYSIWVWFKKYFTGSHQTWVNKQPWTTILSLFHNATATSSISVLQATDCGWDAKVFTNLKNSHRSMAFRQDSTQLEIDKQSTFRCTQHLRNQPGCQQNN